MAKIRLATYLDQHRRLRFEAFSPKAFEVFFHDFFNAGISLVIERDGRRVERKVIGAELFNAGTGRDQKGIDLKLRVEGGETWVVQCKRHKSWSVGQTKKAVADVMDGVSAQHYFLMVGCDPAEGVQDYMATQPKWSFWNLDRICSEFRQRVPQSQQMRVLGFLSPEELRRFAPYASDVLVSADEFFDAPRDVGRAWHHQHTLVGRAEEMRRLRAFATTRSSKAKALLLVGPGGVGKSRLLRELAAKPGKSVRRPEILFLNPHATAADPSGEITRALWDGDTPRLVVVDDAHRPEILPPALLARARECPGVKLLIATRPSALEALRGTLRDHGIIDEPEPLHLAPLAKKDLRALAAEALGEALAVHADDLVLRAGASAFLVALAGDLLRRGQLRWDEFGTDAEFRTAVFRCYEDENLLDVAASDRETAGLLLRLMALVAPFAPNEVFCQRAGRCLDIGSVRVESLIHRIQAAGLLSGGGRELRVVPDLFGDFLVFQTAFDPRKRLPVFVRSVLTAFEAGSGAILRNVAEAVWLAPDQAAGRDELIGPLVTGEMRRFDEADFFERGRTLERWGHFAVYLPAETVALARHAWSLVRAAEDSEDADDDTGGIFSPDFLCARIPDLLHPVVLWQDEQREGALDLLWELGPHPRFRDNAQNPPWGIIADAIGYGPRKSAKATEDTLAWLERLLRRPSARATLEARRHLLATLLGPIFARETKWTDWEGRTCHFRHRRLPPEFVRPWRARALALLRGLIEGDSLPIALAALSALEPALGRICGGMTDLEKDLDHLREVWRPDRLRALELLPLAMTRHPHAVMRHAVRRMLEQDLAYEEDSPFKEAARAVLRGVPDDLSLRLGTVLMLHGHGLEVAYHLGIKWSGESAPEIQRRWEELVGETASEWLTAFPDANAAINTLATLCDEFAGHGYSPTPHELFTVLGRLRPVDARRLLDAIFDGAGNELVKGAWPALAVDLVDTESDLLRRARHHPDALIARGVIEYLERRAVRLGGLDAHARALLEDMAAGTPDDVTLRALLWFVVMLPESEVDWGFAFLRALPLARLVEQGAADRLLDALHPIRAPGKSPPIELVREVLAALVFLPDFGHGHLAYEFSQLKAKYPRACYDFVVARIRRAESLPADARYVPMPQGRSGRFLLPGLETEPDFARICEELYAHALAEIRRNGRENWTLLFQGVAAVHPTHWLDRFTSEVAACDTLESLMQLTELIRFGGSLLVFSQPDLTRVLLSKADKLEGAKGRKKMESRLYEISGPVVRGYTNGVPDAGHDYLEAAALKAAEAYAEDPLLGVFYRWIAALERDDREMQKRLADASLAAMDNE